jgi:hypothetical protein
MGNHIQDGLIWVTWDEVLNKFTLLSATPDFNFKIGIGHGVIISVDSKK